MGLQVLLESLSNHEELSTVQEVRTSCDNAVEVLNEFLVFDKLEGGTLMVEKTRVAALKLIQDTVAPFQAQVRAHCLLSFEDTRHVDL